MKINQTNEKKLHISIMKIICCFSVIIIHACSQSNKYDALNCFFHFSVPIFIMISGKSILSNDLNIHKLIKKIFKFLFLIIVWSFIYYIHLHQSNIQLGSTFFSYLLTGPIHLWYLWAIIGLYLLSPIFHIFCKHANKNIYLYALCFTFISGNIITCLMRINSLQTFSLIINKAHLPYQLGFIFCFLFGHYYEKFGTGTKFFGIILFLIGNIGSIICIPFLPSNIFLSFFSPMTIISSLGFYIFFSNINLAKKYIFVEKLSNYTTGIYLIHPLIIFLTRQKLNTIIEQNILYPFIFSIIIFVLSLSITYIIKKIPLLKKIV